MSRKHRHHKGPPTHLAQKNIPKKPIISSLLEIMKDGEEYQSIVDAMPEGLDIANEVIKSIKEIEVLRSRPCLSYLGNVIKGDAAASVDSTDDLPFIEMVKSIPVAEKKIDVLLSTNGGSGQQINRFVNCLRNRFEEVNFLIPSFCMSAGTLFALSGDQIYMTPNACLGPIDPQIPAQSGRFVPAQALLLLVDKLQKEGEAALKNSQPVPWTAVRIIDTLDKKELGDAISATKYSTEMASQFLQQYKFKHWINRETSQTPVTPQYRKQRAEEIAGELASHEKWKSHGHSISREVLWNEIKLKINHPDDKLERAINRSWALATWIFDKTPVQKMIIASSPYRYLKFSTKGGM